MSGHSKFANIAHKKAANDAAKGKIFTRLGKEIMVAVKEGGPEVNNNSKLRQVVTKAKAANMPNDTIERAIKKAASTDMSSFESVTYEGYGPNGTAIIVEALTDNRNRAASNIRNAFTKGGGNVGTPGCVSFMFDNKGQIIIGKEDCDKDADELMMLALDAGADDFNEEEDCFEVTTAPEDFDAVSEALTNEGITFASAEVTMIPQTVVELTTEDDIKKMRRILNLLDEEDDEELILEWLNLFSKYKQKQILDEVSHDVITDVIGSIEDEDEKNAFTIDELAIILDMKVDEIRDILRLTGDDK